MDLIVLYLLARAIGKQALRKGEKPGRWQWRLVMFWLGLEILGFSIGFSINRNLVLSGLLGFGLAVGGYLIVRHQLNTLPDIQDNWMDRTGREDAR